MNQTEIQLEGYFDFLDPDDIRIKGTRVGIETVLEDYLNASSPEEIAVRYPTLTLEQVYATITYYLHQPQEIERYLERWRNYAEEAWRQQEQHPSPGVLRLRELKRRKTQQAQGVAA